MAGIGSEDIFIKRVLKNIDLLKSCSLSFEISSI